MAVLSTLFEQARDSPAGQAALQLPSQALDHYRALPRAVRVGILVAASVVAVVKAVTSWARPADPSPQRVREANAASITNRFHEDKLPSDPVDFIIIGSGMSGLTSAAVLARCGFRVLVLEQHDRAGGATHMYELGNGYNFDAGLHYTIPLSGPLLSIAAGKYAPGIEFKKMGEADGTFDKIVLGNDAPFHMKHHEAHLAQLRSLFPSPEDQRAIDAYLKISDTLLLSTPAFIISKFLPLWLQKIVWRVALRGFAKYSGQTALEVLQGITTNKKLISLLCGLWIDTGARPDTGTFFLMASVFRGLPHEGGAYPVGGSQNMAASLTRTITMFGGKVLVRAGVDGIVFDEQTGRAVGVRMASGLEIPATQGVISSAGYMATFNKLVPAEVCTRFSIPPHLPFGQSAGFVMVNVGIRGTAAQLGITNTNLWYHPTDANGDSIAPLQRFMASPLDNDMPLMITFPSVKDQSPESAAAPRTTCQILVMADYAWFEQWREEPSGARAEEYVALKDNFKAKALATLLRFYPQLKDHIDFTDVSTPLSIEHYLAAPRGAAVGLDPAPSRFNGDFSVLQYLDSVTPIPGLYTTGQDSLLCGVVMAQIAGLATAMRVAGFWRSVRFVLGHVLY